ncbi:unnamed protein product [Paramecium octaurelia]|uniref:Uncharacterized protein n=1 Tax=Paramecium octaurelia TaxID=43137 RepID=A0A8S1UPA1_PAROT|nr:unnamed protein product [Paramecium octaurelia]
MLVFFQSWVQIGIQKIQNKQAGNVAKYKKGVIQYIKLNKQQTEVQIKLMVKPQLDLIKVIQRQFSDSTLAHQSKQQGEAKNNQVNFSNHKLTRIC